MFNKKNKKIKGAEIEDSVMTVTQKEKAVIELPFERRKLSLFWVMVILVIVGLVGKAFYLQFFQGKYYAEISRNNRIRNVIQKAPRGLILDKQGKILAKNIPSLDAIIIPEDLPDSAEKRKVMAEELGNILKMNLGNVEIILNSQGLNCLNPILLKESITQEQALILAEKKEDFPGIELERTAIRFYEDGSIFSHLIGYDGKITQEELKAHEDYLMTDYIGKNGLEKKYEGKLRGIYGARKIEVDSLGETKRVIGIVEPVPGNDLILNINESLQKKIYDELTQILEETGTTSAAAVAIDPRNGGVLAMVSIPSYDNNLFAGGIDKNEYKKLISDNNLPLFNRAANGEYPPGSTIKQVIAAAALSENIIKEDTIIDGLGGRLYIGSWSFGDWKVHDPSDVRTAIAESNDIFFYTIGGGYGSIEGLGMTRMKKYYDLFGFGEKSGIDLPQEANGLIPNEEWKKNKIGERWYIGDSYHAAIGQGYVTATPLQLANYTATIANGGTLYVPQIANRIRKNDGTEEILGSQVKRSNFIDKEIMRIIREGMRQTVTSGTAQSLKDLPVKVAGKTGTAQFGGGEETHAWFVSFAPYENPEIALAIIVPGAGEGNSSAVPVTKNVYKWYFSHNI